ncbi:MAG: Rrf2 family transcriptional regulator [Candidatus Omnitrophica bacterium]|nr:Rrf2 family transcriptional regulator [Candidatus Omnitrophota bacterium]
MFKIYSKGCEYALRALTQIPPELYDQNFLAKDLCKKAKVPEASTRKIFQSLVKSGVLSAVPGPGGGYVLTRSPAKISLLTIIKSVDGEDAFEKCIMGLPDCGQCNPCPVHNTWKKVKESIIKEMEVKSLAQLMGSVKKSKKSKS